ncbi:MAG: tetratricopeptide repeat protein [Planctomycetes bacterium]|nr:tetratricopeptide repeat protein [Planctomycetota bacterium]
MSRSWRRIEGPLPEMLSKPASFSDPASGYQYHLIADGERVYQEESSEQPGGADRLVREAKYLVGSGTRSLSLVSEDRGYLCQMPLGWFADVQAWKLSPGYELYNWRFSRPIVPGCIACHGSPVVHRAPTRNRYDLPVTEGISCERCHGAGQEHVKQWQAGRENQGEEQPDATIVNPARLTADRANDICLQCHLQGDVSVYPEGAHAFSFQAGDRLTDHRVDFLISTDNPEELGIASHGGRMMRSRCYVESGRSLTCILCHDPHRPVRDFTSEHFDSKCATCHTAQSCNRPVASGESNGSTGCTQCHMPKRTTFESQHLAMTDHWIRRSASAPPVTQAADAKPEEATELVSAWPGEPDEGRLGAAYVLWHESMGPKPAAVDRAIELLSSALRDDPARRETRFWLASALISRYRSRDAVPILRDLLAESPDWRLARFRLGIAYDQLRQYSDAIAQYRQVIDQAPDWMEPYVLLARLHLFRREFSAATQLLNQQLFYQEDATAYANLALARRLGGGPLPESLELIDKALRLEPRLVAGYLNRAVLLSEAGLREQAVADYERVLAMEPGNQTARAGLQALQAAGDP